MPNPNEPGIAPEGYVPTHDEILYEIARITITSALYEAKLHAPCHNVSTQQREAFLRNFNYEKLVDKQANAFVATYNYITDAKVTYETPKKPD